MGEIGEGELRAALHAGAHIRGVVVVARPVDEAIEYTPFLLLSGRRGYFRITRWRGGERRWREFDRLLKVLREFGWTEAVPVHEATDPKLRRMYGVARALGVPPKPRHKQPPLSPGNPESEDPNAVPAGDHDEDAQEPARQP